MTLSLTSTLKGNPDIESVEVQCGSAHNDPVEDSVALARAERLVSGLVKRGVDASRLLATTTAERRGPDYQCGLLILRRKSDPS